MITGFLGIDKAHTHDFYLLPYVTAGTGTHTVDFVTYLVRAGSLFLLTPCGFPCGCLSAMLCSGCTVTKLWLAKPDRFTFACICACWPCPNKLPTHPFPPDGYHPLLLPTQ
ncbi:MULTISPECIES: AraC family ligand binding domain-containing protein [Hymenobacter]|uniref:AraC family ligand binding domain-containing protein n=1 Tax=Hymenobacter TaxID=89966 RepID=UPI0035BBE64E